MVFPHETKLSDDMFITEAESLSFQDKKLKRRTTEKSSFFFKKVISLLILRLMYSNFVFMLFTCHVSCLSTYGQLIQ